MFRNSDSMNGKSAGTVTLGLGAALFTSRTGWPMSSHAAVSSVSTRFFSRAAAMALADDFHAKRLRRLHRPEFRTVHRARNDFAVGRFLDGVRHRLRGHGRAGFARGGNRRRDQFRARARPRRILNGDNFSFGRNGFKPVPDGILPFRAAGDEAERFLKIEFGREFREVRLHPVAHDENDFVNAAASLNCLQVCATTGRPATSSQSLSTFAPMRVPLPAATMMAEIMVGS